ncbi:MAG: translation initiation factor 2 [Hyphomicrobiaceae bacterium]|nr:translation initiation factor 2 [Hyphomicrobiaceae bacterium]
MIRILAILCAALALAGCATVTRGTTNQIQIHSEPSGASARTSLGHTCQTPCTLSVNRKDEFTVVFTLDGYQQQEIQVKTQIAGAGAAGFAGNVIVGGVVGMGVDAVTGSTLEHTPNPVLARMTPNAPAPAPAKPAPTKPKATVPPKPKAVPVS